MKQVIVGVKEMNVHQTCSSHLVLTLAMTLIHTRRKVGVGSMKMSMAKTSSMRTGISGHSGYRSQTNSPLALRQRVVPAQVFILTRVSEIHAIPPHL